uniref:Uncharacterized protein n=1 Tax=Arundo donax TaxID=35708 RepID=A0A0A8XR74_ARUDO
MQVIFFWGKTTGGTSNNFVFKDIIRNQNFLRIGSKCPSLT